MFMGFHRFRFHMFIGHQLVIDSEVWFKGVFHFQSHLLKPCPTLPKILAIQCHYSLSKPPFASFRLWGQVRSMDFSGSGNRW